MLCSMNYVGSTELNGVLWFLLRPTQVAVLPLSVWLSVDILDNGTLDVYVKMARFKERGLFDRAVSVFFSCEADFEANSAKTNLARSNSLVCQASFRKTRIKHHFEHYYQLDR